MTYVELGPDDYQHVQVRLDDGIWIDGTLETYRKVEGVWSGQVRYALGRDESRLEWFEEGRIRGADLG
jgi:hypothetical protein